MKKLRNIIEELKKEKQDKNMYENYKTIAIKGMIWEIWIDENDEIIVRDETAYGWEFDKESETWEIVDYAWYSDDVNDWERELDTEIDDVKFKIY